MKNQPNTTGAKGQSETFASLWPVVNVEYKASFTFLLLIFFTEYYLVWKLRFVFNQYLHCSITMCHKNIHGFNNCRVILN